MEELLADGPATHDDPESGVDDPRERGEALRGARAGRAIEPRNGHPWYPRCRNGGTQHRWRHMRESSAGPAWPENQGMHGT
jgi:hypothetical protein